MRRTATTLSRTFPAIALIGLILLLPYKAFAGADNDVVVRVRDAGQSQAIAKRHGLTITKAMAFSSGDGVFVVPGKDARAIAAILASESAVLSVEDNFKISIRPLDDNGETVLPLDDNGETVLPLDDNGETVLPLDDNGETVLPLDDNGETVLPLEIRKIISFFDKMKKLIPSKHLLIQTSLINIGLYDEALKATGKGVIIADLDTGADSCHPAIGKSVFQLNFVNDNGNPNSKPAPEDCVYTKVPGFGHGTAVGSLIRIVAPEATLWSLRVFDNTGAAQVSDVVEAIIYAVDHGADVINMSFGTPMSSDALQAAIQYAYNHGVVLVAAAGNKGKEGLMYPANYSQVEGVVAVNSKDIKAAFSSYGRKADLSAPGVKLWVAYPGRKLLLASGTSYSSPLAAAEAALILDAYGRGNHRGKESRSDVVDALNSGVKNIDRLNPLYAGKLGHGRIYIPSAVSDDRDN